MRRIGRWWRWWRWWDELVQKRDHLLLNPEVIWWWERASLKLWPRPMGSSKNLEKKTKEKKIKKPIRESPVFSGWVLFRVRALSDFIGSDHGDNHWSNRWNVAMMVHIRFYLNQWHDLTWNSTFCSAEQWRNTFAQNQVKCFIYFILFFTRLCPLPPVTSHLCVKNC